MDATEPYASTHPASEPNPTVQLLYVGGRGIVDEFPRPLTVGVTKVGRKVPRKSGLSLETDKRASRVHAELHVARGGWSVRIVDKRSRNGVFVNGHRVKNQQLKDGDIARLGDSFLLVRFQVDVGDETGDGPILGISPAIRRVRNSIHLYGQSEGHVLITGESGTGKELTARAIHERSGRKGLFVAVNCASIPENLAESQLFGHMPGSFTGAVQKHEGYYRAAQGGTLFLDEIGELSINVQPKLLRSLEQPSIMPVGSTREVATDVRVVAATNTDLKRAIQTKSFRGDLFARLSELTIHIPPLRRRREDIPLLAAHHLGQLHQRISPDLIDLLLLHDWPFNVRELFKVLSELKVRGAEEGMFHTRLIEHRLVPSIDFDSGLPDVDEPSEVQGEDTQPTAKSKEKGRDPVPTAEELVALLREVNGNVSEISRRTGRSRMQVHRWLKKYGLKVEEFR